MSEALSIQAAARECPDACAMISDGVHYSFRQLADKSAGLSLPEHNLHRAPSTLETALLLYRSLDEGRPLCLLSESASAEEWEDCRARFPADLPSDVALVIFTSGSTGQAKGVKLSRRALLASARASEERLGWFGEDRWLCALPLSHIGGLSVLLRALVSRKCVYLCRGFDTERVSKAIESEGITHMSLVPTMLWRLLKSGFRAPPGLRVALMGGAAVSGELAEEAREAGFPLRLSYGMTESGSQIITDGLPLDGVALRVQDDRLEIKAPMLMDGYLAPHQPEVLGDWFRTQDRAEIDAEGRVKILGRADEVIISGGENIDPRAVEAALNRNPMIRTSLAIGLDHEEWGQELVALVVTEEGSPAGLDAGLRGHLKPKLLIPVPELPLLENGKIDRARARAIALEEAARLRGSR
jgi:O-succinylbenzoic acid--CoA ligase